MLFETPFNDHFIKFGKKEKIVWIDSHYMDSSNPKTFFLLLRNAITQLETDGYEKYQQLISYEDFKTITSKMKSYEHIEILEDNEKEEYKLIQCNLEEAIDIIYLGMI